MQYYINKYEISIHCSIVRTKMFENAAYFENKHPGGWRKQVIDI